MALQPTYPGVYVQEISSGLKTITGVSTSVAAFIGSFQRGLLNEAVQIFSMADFERQYGGLDRNSETSYAIQQFFLNGGSQAFVVRVADVDGVVLPPIPGASAASTIFLDKPGGDQIFRITAGSRIRGASAINPGSWGKNLRFEVDYDTADPAEQFNLTISEIAVDGDRTQTVQSELFRNLTMRPDTPNNAIDVLNAGSNLVQLDRAALTPAALPAPFVTTFRPGASGTLGAALAAPTAAIIPNDGDAMTVNIGTGAIAVTIAYNGATKPTTYAGLLPFLQAAIRSAAADALVPDAKKPYLTGAIVKLLAFGGSPPTFAFAIALGVGARPYDPATTVALAGAAATKLKLTTATVGAQQLSPDATTGTDGPQPAPGTNFRPIPFAAFLGTAAAKTGLFALEDVDLFNILCVPEATTMTPANTFALYTQATEYAVSRRAMLIIDIPEAQASSMPAVQTWLADNDGLRDANTAAYFPRTNIPDPLNQNRLRSIGPSGTIAGLWSRTDGTRGVWKAPAGTDAQLRNVASLGYVMTDRENGVLNPLGLNCLRSFPVYSNVCWGARTLDGADVLASDWKYVAVRRTTLYLEESLFRGTKWVVFEPNDEPLWSQIRLNVGAFMQDLFRQGAFEGATPQLAYYVRCGSDTTTQQDIDNGIVNIEVGFAPLKPAEFVILKIQQIVRTPAT